jgi:mannitol/fructose-specific phosphotransferase system IIA component (Ntr-type)
MTLLADYLEEGKILIGFEEQSYRGLLSKMLACSAEHDTAILLDRIFERDKVMTTTPGKGMYLPRVIIKDKPKSEIIIAINPHGICFDDYAGLPAKIIVLFLFSANDDHATIIARCLRMLNDDSLLADLLESKKPKEVINLIRKWEEE